MSGGLLSGLDRVEERPYQGWKTNNLVPGASPENDDVCLLEESSTSGNVEDSPHPTTCLSNGNRNPRDFKAHDSSYKIPKKTVSSNVEVKKGNTWFNSSFVKQYSVRSKYSQSGLTPEKHRNDTDRITQRSEIGYRLFRQAQGSFISPRRWKHASAPGWRQTEVSQSQKEMMLSCQVPDTKHNGTVSTNEQQRHFQAVDKTQPKSNLAEEYKQNRSVSDSIFKGKSTPVIRPDEDKHKDENVGANSSDSDIQAKTRIASQLDSPHSSITKDISQDNYDDLFEDHCAKCLKKFLQGKKCPNCENNVFPSQAATPRKTLSPDRFYSVDSERSKVRTYGKPHGNGPRLLLARSDAKPADSENAVDSCQTNTRFRKRKNKGKSAIESDSDYSPGRPKRSGKQLKLALPKKVDVITLSDEEEVIETSTELIVEQSSHNTDADGFESTASGPGLLSGIEDDKDGDQNSDSTGVKKTKSVTVKRKTPPSQETQPAAKKKSDILHGYTRDDAEIEIMIRQDVRIGTLACTATEPLKIICKTDEIKLGVDYGLKNMSLTIAGNDLTSFKMSQSSNPNVIVLGVTPGYAIKVCQKLPKQRKFLNPGSAISAERDIVLEVSENVKREVIADVEEWCQNRFAEQLSWSEISSKEAQEFLDGKEDASKAVEESSTQRSPKPASPANRDRRKILTPTKGKNARKKLFTEGRNSSLSDVSAASLIVTTNNEPSRTEVQISKEQTDALGSSIVTRSRRRKAPEVVNSNNTVEPVSECLDTVKPDILHHHKEMESHITLLEQHSKEQRENLQQHQRLLEIERGKLREVEEEKERNLGRMRDLEISYSFDKERLVQRIRVLESILSEKDQVLTQQTISLSLANDELEKERASLRRLQNEMEREREANSLLLEEQSDLKRMQSELEDERTIRNMREQQLREKEEHFHELQENIGQEKQARLSLEEELRYARSTCAELERSLENERVLNQSNQRTVQTKEDTIREQMRLLEQERELKTGLEERIRGLQIEVEEERTRRTATERELIEERNILQQNRQNLEREREIYEQRNVEM